MMKASGRAASIVLAGLFLLFGGAAQAAPSSSASSKPDSASKQADADKSSQPRRHTSHRHTGTKTAQKSDDKADKKDAAPQTDEAKAGNDVPVSSQMPPDVANANAQLATADTPTSAAASAMTGRANDNVQAAADNTAAAPGAENQVVPPDQLNDIDRALQQDNPSAQKAGDRRNRRAAASGPGDGEQPAELGLGPELPDRQDLHRRRHAADTGLCRPHVHGLTGPGARISPGAPGPLEAHRASGQIARSTKSVGGA